MSPSSDGRRVVVTGGAGFIGANLCKALVRSPEVGQVAVIDDLSTGSRFNLDGVPVSLVEASVLDRDALDAVLARSDSVVHLAALGSVPRSLRDPMTTHSVNATGTVEVLEAARRADVSHVVFSSSSSVYGGNPVLPKTESLAPRPLSPYAASKLAAESYALSYAQSFGMRITAFRFFNVFGPLQPAGHTYAAVVPAFVHAALAGDGLPIFGDGRQTRDFTYVGTVVDVLVRAVLTERAYSEPVNLAFGTRVSLLELIEMLECLLGRSLERKHLPSRPGDVTDSQADGALLRQLFPEVEPILLKEGLTQTLEWFRSTG